MPERSGAVVVAVVAVVRVNILIVEDEMIVGLCMDDILSSAGHHVVGIAQNAGAAMRMARETRPDLALVDRNLGRGATGCAVVSDLRDQLGIPCIFVTAEPDHEICPRAGALGCLTKPFSPDELIQAVDAVASVVRAQRPARVPPNLALYHSI